MQRMEIEMYVVFWMFANFFGHDCLPKPLEKNSVAMKHYLNSINDRKVDQHTTKSAERASAGLGVRRSLDERNVPQVRSWR